MSSATPLEDRMPPLGPAAGSAIRSDRVLQCALISALAGFLFGFDTVVISGAEQRIQALWQLSAALHGVALGAALYGTVLGAVIGAWPTDRYGRKATLLVIGGLYLVSSLWSSLAMDVGSFIVARFLGGLGIGISTIAAPLYIAEIAPPRRRGLLTGLYQFNIVFGILIASASNSLLASTGDVAWRWMLGVMVVPAALYLLAGWSIPESPRWLICKRGNRDAAAAAVSRIHPHASAADIEAEIASIAAASPAAADIGGGRTLPRRPARLAFLIAFFNQMAGINAILYFAPRIFQMSGAGESAALLQSIGIGVTNLLFTFLGLAMIDRLGRRALLYLGSYGYIASLGLASWAFFTENYGLVAPCIFAFVAAHALGQGTVIWVYISEIFPTEFRAKGQALGSVTHWLFAALLTTLFPTVLAAISPGYVFAGFCGIAVLQLLWVRFAMVETKGATLESMQSLWRPA